MVQQVHRPSSRGARRVLADEIKKRKPDLVGLQEAALWRTGPSTCGAVTAGPKATQSIRKAATSSRSAREAQQGRQEGQEGRRQRRKKKKPPLRYQARRRQERVRLRAAGQRGLRRSDRAACRPQRAPDHARRDPRPQGRQDATPAAAPSTRCCRSGRRGPESTSPAAGRPRRQGQRQDGSRRRQPLRGVRQRATNTGSDGRTFRRAASARPRPRSWSPRAVRRAEASGSCSGTSTPIAGHGGQRPGDALAYRALSPAASGAAFTPPPFSCCLRTRT